MLDQARFDCCEISDEEQGSLSTVRYECFDVSIIVVRLLTASIFVLFAPRMGCNLPPTPRRTS